MLFFYVNDLLLDIISNSTPIYRDKYSILLKEIIIIYCLTSDLDPCWAHADYFLYICGEKTLFKKTP